MIRSDLFRSAVPLPKQQKNFSLYLIGAKLFTTNDHRYFPSINNFQGLNEK